MKYILLMSGVKAGVDSYRAWSKSDIDAHMAVLTSLNRELTESGEFVATQGLAAPHEAVVVRGLKEGDADYRWHLPRIEGVPAGLLDPGGGESGTRLRDCRADFSRAGGPAGWRPTCRSRCGSLGPDRKG